MASKVAYCPKLPWMIDFYTSADGKVHNTQLKAAFTSSHIEHLSNLNPESRAAKHRTTQLMCTIPGSITVSAIEELLDCGMTVARIRLIHINKTKCVEMIDKLRHTCDKFSKKIGRLYPLAIALEFRGTEIRTGYLRNKQQKSIRMEKGQVTKITTDPSFENLVTQELIYVDYQRMSKLVQPGDKILLDCGKVTLSAIEVAEEVIKCMVKTAGDLGNYVPVTLLNAPTEVAPVSDEYMKNIEFAIEQQVDAVIMTSITDESHIEVLKQKLQNEEKSMLIIAKIENSQALENFDAIIKSSHGIYVGATQLINEYPKEKIFLVQKSIMAKCNKIGKPVICNANVAQLGNLSKAEICSIANTVEDGCDCISFDPIDVEDKFFFDSLREVDSICREAESASHQKRIFAELTEGFTWATEPIYSLSISVVESSFKCNAAAIIILSRSGRGARCVSRFRPRCPIIAVTRLEQLAKQLQIYRGVIPVVFVSKKITDWKTEVEERVQLGITFGKLMGYIKMGDILIVVSGDKRSSGFTNSMRIVFASQFDVLEDEDI